MRIVADSPGKPKAPISMLLSPVVRRDPAPWPNAMLKLPVVLLKSAPAPIAVFSFAVLRRSAPAPMAVLKLPPVRGEISQGQIISHQTHENTRTRKFSGQRSLSLLLTPVWVCSVASAFVSWQASRFAIPSSLTQRDSSTEPALSEVEGLGMTDGGPLSA